MNKNDIPQSEDIPDAYTSDRQPTLIEHPDNSAGSSPGTRNSVFSDVSRLQQPESLVGQQIGSDSIVEYIGSGGMGDVYKLRIETLDCFHAVKLLKPTDNQLQEQRFDQERKITAKLDHPNIVRAYNGGRWKQYQFLEMEYIEGTPLDEILRQKGRLTPQVSVAIAIIIARALKYAHNHSYTLDGNNFTGVIHRDLKPANIILAKNGILKLMDFGIARPIGHRSEKLTLEGRLVGTLSYLSPEQINSDPVDQRTDIYALGEVLYEILTGKIAFNAQSEFTIQKNKIEGRYPPVEITGTGIPGKLLSVIDKCMKATPKSRYQSASELLEELTKIFTQMTSMSPEEVLELFVRDKSTRTPDITPEQNKTSRLFLKIPGNIKNVTLVAVVAVLILLLFHTITEKRGLITDAVDPSPISSLKLVSPDNGAVFYSDTVSLSWNTIRNDIKPGIHVATSVNFIDTVHFFAFVSDTFLRFPIKKPRTYFVRIGLTGMSNVFTWADTCNFKVDLGVPVLIAPVHGAKDSASRITIRWSSVLFADSYCIHIASKEDFTDSLHYIFDYPDTVHDLNFSSGGTFYWRIKPYCKGEPGAWSSPDSFRIEQRDYPAIIRENIQNREFEDAEKGLAFIPDGRLKDTLLIMLAQKLYDNKGPLVKVDSLLKTARSYTRNLLPVVVKGRILLDKNLWFKALIMIQSALPDTQYNRWQISAETVYYYAKAAVACYYAKKNDLSRKTATDALRDACKWYKRKPSHPHYLEATKMLREITSQW